MSLDPRGLITNTICLLQGRIGRPMACFFSRYHTGWQAKNSGGTLALKAVACSRRSFPKVCLASSARLRRPIGLCQKRSLLPLSSKALSVVHVLLGLNVSAKTLIVICSRQPLETWELT